MVVRNRGSRSQTLQVKSVTSDSAKFDKRARKRSRLGCCTLSVLLVLFSLYVGIAVLIRHSDWVQQAVTYVHHIKIPYYGNLSDPTSYGLTKTRQFLLHQDDGCSIPVWQTLPSPYHSPSDGAISDDTFTTALSDGAPIVLYLHGNTGTRATFHRVGLYKFLSEDQGYHVVTFDYRGFAESECYPSERGMMEDGLLAWKWIRQHAPSARVYIWGHSLGSATATYLTQELHAIEDHPSGVILDAPFTNIPDAASHHPFSIPYWPVMPLFKHFVLEAFTERFESATRLKDIKCPILILHGKQDIIIPFGMGRQMYEKARALKGEDDVTFLDCGETVHKTNYKSPGIVTALDKFIK